MKFHAVRQTQYKIQDKLTEKRGPSYNNYAVKMYFFSVLLHLNCLQIKMTNSLQQVYHMIMYCFPLP